MVDLPFCRTPASHSIVVVGIFSCLLASSGCGDSGECDPVGQYDLVLSFTQGNCGLTEPESVSFIIGETGEGLGLTQPPMDSVADSAVEGCEVRIVYNQTMELIFVVSTALNLHVRDNGEIAGVGTQDHLTLGCAQNFTVAGVVH